jgi:hypothetical protein
MKYFLTAISVFVLAITLCAEKIPKSAGNNKAERAAAIIRE